VSEAMLAPRVDVLLGRLDAWSDWGVARAIVVKVVVTVAGPLVIVAGIAMLVLPGPGLVVMAAGLALLALEYPWARHVLALLGRGLSRGRELVLPKGASGVRRVLGLAVIAGIFVAGFLATTAATAFLGAHTVL
jgi:putative transmembrane protein PGPGW